MRGLDSRLSALAALADRVDGQRDELIAEVVATTKQTVAVAADDVHLAVRRLRSFGEVADLLDDRQSVHTVGIQFPSNAVLANPVGTIGTAFLAGNQVRVRFPTASSEWGKRVEALLCPELPGVVFERSSGQKFLRDLASDPDTRVVIVFGDDRWAQGYRDLMRSTRTKFIFEGPGKDPLIVLPGCDIDAAARDAVRGGCYNAGQVCTSPERVYVHRSLYREFLVHVVDLARAQAVGLPTSPETTVGPIVNRRVAARIAAQLDEARAGGAQVLAGGDVETGYLDDGTSVTWVDPTVVVDVHHGMSLLRDETFGPVLPVAEVADAEQALRWAAASDYGLSASLYGGGPQQVAALAQTHGRVFHNEIWLAHNRRHCHPPYGGRKRSGWVWEWQGGRFRRREGPRSNALEFSRPAKGQSARKKERVPGA